MLIAVSNFTMMMHGTTVWIAESQCVQVAVMLKCSPTRKNTHTIDGSPACVYANFQLLTGKEVNVSFSLTVSLEDALALLSR